MKVFTLVAIGLFGSIAARSQDFSGAWMVMPVSVNGATDLTKCLPENGEWTMGAFAGKIPQTKDAKKGNLQTGEYNAWYKRTLTVPKEWEGKSVRLEFGLHLADAVVFVNGREVGKAFHPDGAVELADALKYGADNEIKIFVGNCGFGTNEKLVYLGRDEVNIGGQLGIKLWNAKRDALRLEVRNANWIEEAWVEPSWRKKELHVYATIQARQANATEFSAVITEDADGKEVRKGATRVALKPGANAVHLVIPWENPIPWEPVKNAHLYRCTVALKGGDSAVRPFLFGFREIWRDGKEIWMNGHLQRFRGFWNQGVPKELADLHDYGYNLSYETHQHQGLHVEDQTTQERYSRAGICRFTGLPSIYSLHGWTFLHKDEVCFRQWKRQLAYWMKSARNWPCIVAASCGVNQICPTDNMVPGILAQSFTGLGNIACDINLASRTAREMHPNCLYFSHADGTEQEADLSSSNLYFNFTPLQEREEWLSSWAEKGIRPWYAAEFGAPYYACWFHSRVPEPTEWLAAYYGERAYAEETTELLENLSAFAKDCRRLTHGGWVKGRDLYEFSPLMEEYSRMLVYRTNRAWRGFGQNGGLMYLTSWKWDHPNRIRERQRLANGPLVTWLGGAPQITDRTHAYWAGEKIVKTLVFCWDGVTETSVQALWRLVDAQGRAVTSGSKRVDLKPGDIVKEPLEVSAPDVRERTEYRFEVSFEAAGIDESVKSDQFAIEVYPAAVPARAETQTVVGFCDPEGLTAAWMKKLGVEGTNYADLTSALADASLTHLVIGRRALDQFSGLEAIAPRIAKGLRLWVAPQSAETWEAMGFKVEDSCPRQMWDVKLGLGETALAHWRGEPAYARKVGSMMAHKTRRGPRWTHTHALGVHALLIPNKAGFVPLVRGEFDLSYTLLAEAFRGQGSTFFCAFDFEERVGVCPAATAVARKAVQRFLSRPQSEVAERKLYAADEEAERLLRKLGADFEKGRPGKAEKALLVAGPSADADKLQETLGGNTALYVFGNADFAKAVGLSVSTGRVSKVRDLASIRDVRVFEGVGGSLLRWREPLEVGRLSGGSGWTLAGEGLFAAKGESVVIDAVDPFQLCDRYRKTKDAKALVTRANGGWGIQPQTDEDLYLRSVAQSEENDLRRIALILHNLGARAGEKTFARSLYADPCPGGTEANLKAVGHFNVLGPWPCGKGDFEKTLDQIYPVEEGVMGDTGEKAEEMARAGDVQPNPRFHPIGAIYKETLPPDLRFIDWRPGWQQQPTGIMSIDWMTAPARFVPPCAWYAVGYLPRREDGTISLKFSTATAGKVWVNGREVCRSVNNSQASVDDVPVYANGHQGDGTFEGVNVISVKIVTEKNPKLFNLLVSRELSATAKKRQRVKELEGIELYETANPQFDPYEYIYW